MATLKETLQEKEHLGTALSKQNWYTEEEAYADIIEAVKEWLTERGNGIDVKFDNAESDYMRKMCEGAKYTIRGLLKDLE
jgi:hypothetical protein